MPYKLVGWPEQSDVGGLSGLCQPDSRPLSRTKYVLVTSYWVRVRDVETSYSFSIVIPAPFIYDGASIPRLAWSLLGLRPDGLIRAAAVVHDVLYAQKGPANTLEGTAHYFSREEADKLFLDLMLAAGVSKRRATLAYRAVRWFGPRW